MLYLAQDSSTKGQGTNKIKHHLYPKLALKEQFLWEGFILWEIEMTHTRFLDEKSDCCHPTGVNFDLYLKSECTLEIPCI